MSDQLSCGVGALWEAIFRLHAATQVPQLKNIPGLWEYKINHQWKLWANGHQEEAIIPGGVLSVPPFSVFFEFNGWPAGLLDANGMTIAAGSVANLDTLIEAILAETKRLSNGRQPKEDSD